MPLDIQCPSCQSRFRVAEKFAGKRVKCTNCHGSIEVPVGAERSAEPPAADAPPALSPPREAPPAATSLPHASATDSGIQHEDPFSPPQEAWYLQTAEGEQYGPATRPELDAWVAEGRVDATCQVFQEGWQQWKAAHDVYPQLAAPSAAIAPAAPEADDPLAAIADYAVEAQRAAGKAGRTPEERMAAEKKPPQSDARQSLPSGYPALAALSRIFSVLAWVMAGLGALQAIVIAVAFFVGLASGHITPMEVIATGVVVTVILSSAVLAWVSLSAIAELVKLAMDVAHHNRATSEACVKMAELLAKPK